MNKLEHIQNQLLVDLQDFSYIIPSFRSRTYIVLVWDTLYFPLCQPFFSVLDTILKQINLILPAFVAFVLGHVVTTMGILFPLTYNNSDNKTVECRYSIIIVCS